MLILSDVINVTTFGLVVKPRKDAGLLFLCFIIVFLFFGSNWVICYTKAL